MKRVASCAAVVLAAATVTAHEYWLEPEKTSGQAGDRVAVRLWLGEAFKGEEEKPFERSRIVSLAIYDAKGKQEANPEVVEGGKPFATVTLRGDGGQVLACERTPATIELDAVKFTAYLKEEGLDAVVAERVRRGESDVPGRERYSRHLKALLQVGDKPDRAFATVVGHRLEIVPLDPPSQLAPNARLRVLVLFEGKPLEGATVFADLRKGIERPSRSAKTDREGIASVPIDVRGPTLLRLVHMRRAPEGAAADWESFWAAYTFGSG